MVILTGDIVDGRPFTDAGGWMDSFKALVEPLVAMGAVFTFVPGNHDDDNSPWSREDLLGVYSMPGCISHGATGFDHTFTVSPAGTRIVLIDTGEVPF